VTWFFRALAALGLAIVLWALVTSFGAVVHGHPAYAVLLLVTVVGSAFALWRHRARAPWVTGWRRFGSVLLVVGAVIWLAAVAWLRPHSAEEPALAAMRSDGTVRVQESATRIVLKPTGTVSPTGVIFQPGAKVEARAYAAVLRPLAEAGYQVVIVKQPLAIAFLALGAVGDVQDDYPSITSWIVGGHSLGGTVAAMEADDHDSDATSPVRGLLLYASYPASDISDSLTASVLSISGSNDGLATPEKIQRSQQDLPAASRFTVVDGGIHAFFGDYGSQSGDGTPTISHDDARRQIIEASVAFVDEVAQQAPAAH
jgi:hypothetical protein